MSVIVDIRGYIDWDALQCCPVCQGYFANPRATAKYCSRQCAGIGRSKGQQRKPRPTKPLYAPSQRAALRAEVKALYLDGWTQKQISARYEKSQGWVSKMLTSAGVSAKDAPPRPRPPAPLRGVARHIEEVKRLYVVDGLTLQQISNKYEVSRERIRQILSGAGVSAKDKPPKSPKPPKPVSDYTLHYRRQRELAAQGLRLCCNPDCPSDNPQPTANFYAPLKARGYVSRRCKTCTAAYARSRRQNEETRKHDRAVQAAWQKNNKDKTALYEKRYRDKKKRGVGTAPCGGGFGGDNR